MTNPQNASDRTACRKMPVRRRLTTRWPTHSLYAANCHCSGCRRATGSAFKPFAGIERDKLAPSPRAKTNYMLFGDATGYDARTAGMCGSLLYSVVRDGTFVHVAMGTLVDEPTIRPTKHIFVGSKARWFAITDDLPQHEEHAVASGPAGGQE